MKEERKKRKLQEVVDEGQGAESGPPGAGRRVQWEEPEEGWPDSRGSESLEELS